MTHVARCLLTHGSLTAGRIEAKVGRLRNREFDLSEPLDSGPIVLVRCTKLKHLFIS
jgi:hypothetical protein